MSSLLNFILFAAADDTNTFFTGSDINNMCEIISNELSKLDDWFKANKFSLNVAKTKFIVFTQKYQ